VTEAGIALLLYADRGFLPAVGLLASLALAALAGGMWVGLPDTPDATAPGPVQLLQRWTGASATLLAGGIFALFWSASRSIGASGIGRGIGALLLLAAPAYALGALVIALHRSAQARAVATSVPVIGGAALGVLAGSVLLIPRVDASVLFVGAGAALGSFGYWWSRWLANVSEDGMNDTVVVVTGVGGKGQLGYALAEALLERGMRVVITDIAPAVREHAAALGDRARIIALEADLTSETGAASVIALAVENFQRVDALINVAGGLSVIKPIADTSAAEWKRELERNASTAFFMTRAALPALRERGGTIVNFSSPTGFHTPAALGAYSAAKAAVSTLTRAVALEEKKHGIRVNAIAPGIIDTEQNRQSATKPDAKFVSRQQIVDVVLFLLSDAGSGINGQTIQVLGETLS
jgi:NAD(P)-dependent dehydrogenase (short-subunit alcohol dehydrogenase family)